MWTETLNGSRETFELSLSLFGCYRLPVKGIIKRYKGEHISDNGTRRVVFVSSTEKRDENGNLKWTESVMGTDSPV